MIQSKYLERERAENVIIVGGSPIVGVAAGTRRHLFFAVNGNSIRLQTKSASSECIFD